MYNVFIHLASVQGNAGEAVKLFNTELPYIKPIIKGGVKDAYYILVTYDIEAAVNQLAHCTGVDFVYHSAMRYEICEN